MKVRTCAISLFAVVVLLVACGGDSSGPTDEGSGGATTGGGNTDGGNGNDGGGGGGEGTPTDTITIKDLQFTPVDPTISSTEITLVNNGSALHNVSVQGQGIDHDVPSGESESEDFELPPGSYTFFCKYHRDKGMEGTLTVT